MSVLDDLYNGNVNPSGKYIKKNSEYQKLSFELMERIDELMLNLDENEKQLCEVIEKHIYELCHISEKEQFVEGFRLGAQMMFEILKFESENFTKN